MKVTGNSYSSIVIREGSGECSECYGRSKINALYVLIARFSCSNKKRADSTWPVIRSVDIS